MKHTITIFLLIIIYFIFMNNVIRIFYYNSMKIYYLNYAPSFCMLYKLRNKRLKTEFLKKIIL